MTHHLAQLNVGIPVAPLDSAELAPFMDALDSVNESADTAPGFVWRLQTEEGNATSVVPATLGPEWIVNISTWESIESLRDFVYRDPAHLAILRRRREFFERVKLVLVLWWVPGRPSPDRRRGRGTPRSAGPARPLTEGVHLPGVLPATGHGGHCGAGSRRPGSLPGLSECWWCQRRSVGGCATWFEPQRAARRDSGHNGGYRLRDSEEWQHQGGTCVFVCAGFWA